jgi:hypothetical protein
MIALFNGMAVGICAVPAFLAHEPMLDDLHDRTSMSAKTAATMLMTISVAARIRRGVGQGASPSAPHGRGRTRRAGLRRGASGVDRARKSLSDVGERVVANLPALTLRLNPVVSSAISAVEPIALKEAA